MDEYTVNVEDGWNGYSFGDKVTVTALDENDLAVLVKIGVLVKTTATSTQKVEEAPNGNIPE